MECIIRMEDEGKGQAYLLNRMVLFLIKTIMKVMSSYLTINFTMHNHSINYLALSETETGTRLSLQKNYSWCDSTTKATDSHTVDSADVGKNCSNNHACRTHSIEIFNFETTGKFMFKFDDSIILDNHNYCQQHMNIQSWKISQSQSSHTKRENQGELSGYMEQVFNNSSKEEKYKAITMANFFECKTKANFIVTMAKFIVVFNINIEEMKCLQKLNKKQLNFIKDCQLQNVVYDAKRKQFSKFLQKSTDGMVNLTATFCNNFQGLVMIIQNCENQEEPKFKVTFLNHKNLIHSILTNLKHNEEFEQLGKFIDSKYKKIPTVVCYNLMKNKQLNVNFLTFLLIKFDEVFYAEQCQQHETDFLNVNELTTIQPFKKLTVAKNDGLLLIGTHRISPASIASMSQFLRKHQKINRIIRQHIQKLKKTREIFNQNQLCISFFGIYYNFISLHSLENSSDQVIIQNSFLSQFIQEKQNFQENAGNQKSKKVLKRKLGHYPQKIEKKGRTKVCCVCGINKKKSRYKCEWCSDRYNRDIVLCLEHFKLYHRNTHRYIPKGVRKGAYKSEIEQFNELNDEPQNSKQQQETEQKAEEQELDEIFQKWELKSLNGQYSLNFMASMIYQNAIQSQITPYYYQIQNHQEMLKPSVYNYDEQIKQEQCSSLKVEQQWQQ